MIDIPDNKDLFQPELIPSEDRVRQIKGLDRVEQKERTEDKKKRDQQKFNTGKEKVKDHFEEILKAVHEAHRFMEENNYPYRFCVYKENDEIYIDLMILNAKGQMQTEKIKRISMENFDKMLAEIYQGRGLFFEGNF